MYIPCMRVIIYSSSNKVCFFSRTSQYQSPGLEIVLIDELPYSAMCPKPARTPIGIDQQ